ncbi:MAG: 3-keto-5-aminohexanoate cleavage protein [Alphaproteobacteria bacterium]|nr:3-keto-5-aminohexanoate cleavage protein [Alphaproteobacteria bacterium]
MTVQNFDIDAPLILAVAPNGARKTRADHPAMPVTADECARAAAACRDAGAAMIHLHVRDADGKHSLDADTYVDAIAAVRRETGDGMIIQMTTEAVGIYRPEEQMAAVRAVRPEAVSMAIRELCPDEPAVGAFAGFLSWLKSESISPQFILYSPDDCERFADLRRLGVVPYDRPFVLNVLGRYTPDQKSVPANLLPFLQSGNGLAIDWAICAFGPRECACALTAAALGGHARVGFENNIHLADGSVAPDNAALVGQIADGTRLLGRGLADADRARAHLGRP